MDRELQASPYYPPRARWYSPLLRIGYVLKRRLHLSIVLDHEQVCQRALLGLVLPGWALLWSKRPNLGVILGSTYLLAAPVFLIWRGYTVSNVALMVMISIHAGSILRMESFSSIWVRCGTSFLAFFAIAALIYAPLINVVDRHWFVALRTGDRVVAVRTGNHPTIHRGNWIAYRINANYRRYSENVVIMGGTGLGKVMAVAGDEIKFEPGKFLINGKPQPRRDNMPIDETLRIQDGCYFVWPDIGVQNGGFAQIGRALLELAVVKEKDIIGVPYQRWFWRKQVLS